MSNNIIKKFLIIVLGFITLILGVVGIFLPILPTTPFLLLSAYCFLKSSEKMYVWLINNKILGAYVKTYIEYKAITIRAKAVSIASLWSVMGISIIFFVDSILVRLLLVFIAICVTIYLIRFKTITKAEIQN